LRFDPSRHDSDDKEHQRALIPFGPRSAGLHRPAPRTAEIRAIVPALARHGDITLDRTPAEDASFALRIGGRFTGTFTSRRDMGPSARERNS
jgi:hypothetical protein